MANLGRRPPWTSKGATKASKKTQKMIDFRSELVFDWNKFIGGIMLGEQTTIYIPENDTGIIEGYYTVNEFVGLLRNHKHEPKVIQFLADMLEI